MSIRYTERLAEAGIEPPVRNVGDSYDNALAEAINGLYNAPPVLEFAEHVFDFVALRIAGFVVID